MLNAISASRFRARSLGSSQVGAKGLLLSHLIGLCFFLAMVVSRAITIDVGPTKLMDWPIRLVGIWLILDRFGRDRRIKVSAWDWTHILFVVGYGLALIYAELYMQRDSGFINYLQWIAGVLNGYFFFLVVREGTTRIGFNPGVLVQWLLWTIGICAAIAIVQSRDLLHLRHVVDNFYHQGQFERYMEGPSAPWQARGPAPHANTMALMLLFALPLFGVLGRIRKLRVWEYALALLMIFTVFATYSRIGIVTLGAVEVGIIGVMLVRREYAKAAGWLGVSLALALVFALVVITFDIQRFKVLVSPGSPVQFSQESDTVGWKLRQVRIANAFDMAERYPLTGISAASGSLNLEGIVVRNEFTFHGLLMNLYAYSFVSYGLMGLAFLGGILWTLFSQIRYLRKKSAYAAACVLAGVAIVVAGLAENVIFVDQAMITVNILVALASAAALFAQTSRAPKAIVA